MKTVLPSGGDGPGAGRPPVTTHAELAKVALSLFVEHGFDETSVDDIAVAAQISRSTFFRYFPSKSAVVWHELEDEIDSLRASLAHADLEQPMMDVIRQAVLAINKARVLGVRELRSHTVLINRVPALQGPAAVYYARWADVISEFVAQRLQVPQNSLFPIAVGRAVLACARAAYDVWVQQSERSLVAYLEQALGALGDAFTEDALHGRAIQQPFTTRVIASRS